MGALPPSESSLRLIAPPNGRPTTVRAVARPPNAHMGGRHPSLAAPIAALRSTCDCRADPPDGGRGPDNHPARPTQEHPTEHSSIAPNRHPATTQPPPNNRTAPTQLGHHAPTHGRRPGLSPTERLTHRAPDPPLHPTRAPQACPRAPHSISAACPPNIAGHCMIGCRDLGGRIPTQSCLRFGWAEAVEKRLGGLGWRVAIGDVGWGPGDRCGLGPARAPTVVGENRG